MVKVIPCMDMKGGRVVKGVQFVDLKDAGDPVECAVKYAQMGADEVAFLDITATNEKRDNILADIISQVRKQVDVPITIGGGIKTLDDIKILLDAGATKVSIASAAIRNPVLVKKAADTFGKDKIVVAIDAKYNDEKGIYEAYVDGGRTNAGIDAAQFAKNMADDGACAILLTGLDTDGTKAGYDCKMLRAIADASGIDVIASGGAGRLEDFYDAVVKGGASAVLAASLFHFGELTVGQVKDYLRERGIEVALSPGERFDIQNIKYNSDGLVPVITQDVRTGAVLMQAYMNEETLRMSIEKGRMVYWSRSRQEVWEKGATSGQTQEIVSLTADCDADCLLAKVVQNGGGACHTGNYSCFHNPIVQKNASADRGAAIFYELSEVIADRRLHPKPGSYTNKLFEKGLDKILKKVGEEATEVVIAAKNDSRAELTYEVADLLYHLLVMLEVQDVPLEDVFTELSGRR